MELLLAFMGLGHWELLILAVLFLGTIAVVGFTAAVVFIVLLNKKPRGPKDRI